MMVQRLWPQAFDRTLKFGIATIVLIYSLSAVSLSLKLGIDTNRVEWFNLFVALLWIIGLIGIIGVLRDTRWGAFCIIVFGLYLSFYFLTGKLAVPIIFINFFVGVGICVYGVQRFSDLRTYKRERESSATPSVIRTGLELKIGKQLQEEGMSENLKNIDELKYNLEREKFLWHKATYQKDNSILNRNFGVIITAIVSFAAVFVSYMQLTISSNNTKAQIENESLKNDRQFYFEIAKFLLASRQELTTRDNDKVIYLRNVVVSSFPKEAAIQICARMRDMAGTMEVKKIWEEGLAYVEASAESAAAR